MKRKNPNELPRMSDVWAKFVEALAKSMGVSTREAAELIMAEFRIEAERIAKEAKFGLLPDHYDPANDSAHPNRGWFSENQ